MYSGCNYTLYPLIAPTLRLTEDETQNVQRQLARQAAGESLADGDIPWDHLELFHSDEASRRIYEQERAAFMAHI